MLCISCAALNKPQTAKPQVSESNEKEFEIRNNPSWKNIAGDIFLNDAFSSFGVIFST